MPSAVRTYDPGAVVLSVGGVPIGGYADGTFILVERSEDSFTAVVGAQGITSRAKSNNRMGQITITLAMTSPSNDALSLILVADELTNSGIVPVLCEDKSGRSKHFSALAWVTKVPNKEYGKEVTNVEWVLMMADYDAFLGGNASFEPEV